MAMSVVYATINGQIVSENRGGVISYYAPDNLGSTVALLDATGTVTDTFTYWPYGEIQSHVGSSVTPFTFCGTLGYYLDVPGTQSYIRARYLRQSTTRWQTLDELWPIQVGYGYAQAAPCLWADPSGASPCRPPSDDGVQDLIFENERDVVWPFGNTSSCHWFLTLDCGRPGGNSIGYGPGGLCQTYAGNAAGYDVLNTSILVSHAQKKCLCENIHNSFDLHWSLCGSNWDGKDFHCERHNCHDLVKCLCRKCGIERCSRDR